MAAEAEVMAKLDRIAERAKALPKPKTRRKPKVS